MRVCVGSVCVCVCVCVKGGHVCECVSVKGTWECDVAYYFKDTKSGLL